MTITQNKPKKNKKRIDVREYRDPFALFTFALYLFFFMRINLMLHVSLSQYI